MAKNLVRALRLPFISASVFPFILGSLVSGGGLNALNFLLGLICVISTHLSANLINDYADSRSGVDWQDKGFYKFFGGSKLIQEGKFTEKFYLKLSLAFAVIAGLSVLLLSLRLRSLLAVALFAVILSLAWAYSMRPLQFSYRMAGELIIFLLFGPALVMGGYFIQTGDFPALKSFVLSLPFGFLTTAILFSNEVPDFSLDLKGNKLTWVNLTGQKGAFIFYLLLMFFAQISIAAAVWLKFISPAALFSFVSILPALGAAKILRTQYCDKIRLMESSRLTTLIHTFVSIVLIASALSVVVFKGG